MAKKIPIGEIEKAIIDSYGILSDAAKKLGISRDTLYRRIRGNKRLKEAVEKAREALKDFGEGQLIKLMKKGDRTAIIFYLKTQAKDRGYVERQELTGKDGDPVLVKGYTNLDPDKWPE